MPMNLPPITGAPELDDPAGPLAMPEFERLEALLAPGPACMSLEEMDGYLAGLVCAPARGSIALAFGPVLGVEATGDADFLGDAERHEVEHLLWRHWCTIAATLEAAGEAPGLRYVPLLFEDGWGQVAGNEWARGFSAALRREPAAWAAFVAAAPASLAPVEALAAEPAAGPRFDAATREAHIASCADLLIEAWRHFSPLRG